MGAAVAKQPDKGAKDKPDMAYTTVRLQTPDGEDLSDLAKLLGLSADVVYHEHCAPVIRKLLREKLAERMKRLTD